ncbi:MAG: ATP-NAD kinase family protein [Thermodesulfobacteriota bacterium]
MRKLGVIVNPIAGIGGRVGLKGSDGPEVLRLARERGAEPEASERAREALLSVTLLADQIEVVTYPGEMGAEACLRAGLRPRVIGNIQAGQTTAADTEAAARQMLAEGVDLLLFVGGDGTARDICDVVDERLPVIGVPAGVKIHSAVFAVNPHGAGLVAREYLERRLTRCRPAEVMDLDEDAFRQGVLTARLYGSMCVPDGRHNLQGTKIGGLPTARDELAAIAQTVIEGMDDPDRVYIIGPGTTTRVIKQMLGLEHTLLGVDAVRDRKLVALDADERRLLELIKDHRAEIIVTVIGGQGHLFGRGNQQISPRVIRAVGKEHIVVVATEEKLLGLEGKPLPVDTGDPALDKQLAGHIRVITGYRKYTVYRVGF